MPLHPPAKRFAPRAKNEYVFMPTVAAAETDGTPKPDATEISGGTWLTDEIFEINGFSTQTNYTQSSDAGTFFIGKIPVSEEAADASIVFNGSEDGNDIRAILTQGQRGYLLLSPAGITAGSIAEVYEVIVGSISVNRDLNDYVKITVGFGVPSKPNQAFEMPATGVTKPTS